MKKNQYRFRESIKTWFSCHAERVVSLTVIAVFSCVVALQHSDGFRSYLLRDLPQYRSASSQYSSSSSRRVLKRKIRARRPLTLQRNSLVAAGSGAAVLPLFPVPASSSSRSRLPATVPQHAAAPLEPTIASSSSASAEIGGFPPFVRTVFPVSRVPNWGAMKSPSEWNRTYAEMSNEDFVPVPAYDLAKLTRPLSELVNPRNDEEITRKLYYSTHFFGAYDVDAAEFTAVHPGVDLKLALGTPIGAIAGGRVASVHQDSILGLHVIVEHRLGGETYYSIYGHFGSVAVREGDAVRPGQMIGTVGMTGSTSGPHLHLQIDRGAKNEEDHRPYLPSFLPSPEAADRFVVHPVRFIVEHADGN